MGIESLDAGTFPRTSVRLASLRRRLRGMAASLAIFLAGPALAAGNVIEYVHDAAGNITQVRRLAAPGLAITGFEPSSGPAGAPVTIFGYGFSATPAGNIVTFNGTAATPTAVDAGAISVAVPVGATSGPVTVTVGASTATSAASFQVTAPGEPAVTGFAPGIGVPGTSVTVSGTNFDPAPGATAVQVGGSGATATVSGATALAFTVPADAGSGRISVTTASGTGVSATDFVVAPDGYAPGDVITTLTLSPGGAAGALAIGTPSRHAVVLFDANDDTFYTVQFSQLATSPTNSRVDYRVYKPDNTVLKSGAFGMSWDRPTIHLPKLPAPGTYAIFVSPGAATLSASVTVAADPVLAVDGPMVAIAPPGSTLSARTVFAATAGQRIGIGVSGFTLAPHSSSATNFHVYQPDGTRLGTGSQAFCYAAASGYSAQGNCDGELVANAAGTYTMVSETIFGTQASYSVQLSNDASGTLSPDLPQDVVLARLGQDGFYTFTAAAGDSLAVELFGVAPASEAKPFNLAVYRPNGSLAGSAAASSPSWAGMAELGTISVAGTHSVVVDPSYGAHGAARIALRQGAMLETADPPSAFATAVAGESVRFRLSGTAGQRLSLGVDGLAYEGASASTTTLAVRRPDGTSLASIGCLPTTAGGRCKLNLPIFTASGTYSVRITPPAGVRVSGNVALSGELTGTLMPGVTVPIAVSRPGQNVRYEFAGTAGESTSIELSQLATNPSGQFVYAYVYKPDGTLLSSGNGAGNRVFVNLASLPVTGTYTVFLDAYHGVPYTGLLTLKPGAALAMDGPTETLATAAPGEVVRYTFPGTAGVRAELGVSGLAYGTASSSATAANIYGPNGSSVGSASCQTASGGRCEIAVASLPSTGTYSIVLAPPLAVTLSGGTLALSSPLVGTLAPGGAAEPVGLTRPGQTARYAFTGTAGQLLRLNWAGTTIAGSSYVTVSILKPDGSSLTSGSYAHGATGGLDIPSLPSTGTYTVVLDPPSASLTTASLTLVTR